MDSKTASLEIQLIPVAALIEPINERGYDFFTSKILVKDAQQSRFAEHNPVLQKLRTNSFRNVHDAAKGIFGRRKRQKRSQFDLFGKFREFSSVSNNIVICHFVEKTKSASTFE